MSTIKQRSETVLAQLENEGEHHDIWWYLPYTLIPAAAVYFEQCPDDFCVQHIGEQAIVFGGTNRLIFTHSHGFTPDQRYCTKAFLHHYEQIGKLPMRTI